jgi:hypothetical protein
MPHAEKQIEAAKYQLSQQHHITVWSGEMERFEMAFQTKLSLSVNKQRL